MADGRRAGTWSGGPAGRSIPAGLPVTWCRRPAGGSRAPARRRDHLGRRYPDLHDAILLSAEELIGGLYLVEGEAMCDQRREVQAPMPDELHQRAHALLA